MASAASLLRALLLSGLALALAPVQAALAQQQPQVEPQPNAPAASQYLVVDLNRILREAAAVQALQEQVGAAREHFHVPVLISPRGYSPYRGS